MSSFEPTILIARLEELGFTEAVDFGPEDARTRYLSGRTDGLVTPHLSRLMKVRVGPFLKVAVVAGGYGIAFLMASAAVAIRIANTSGPGAQASSGMYAFGDALLFAAVFGVAALVPTGVALFFLRPYRRFWTVLAALGLAVAVTGVTAAILYAVGRHATSSPLATWAGLSVLRILAAPLLALGLVVCTIFSPHRSPRLAFLVATVMEAAVSAYGAFTWFVPLLFPGP